MYSKKIIIPEGTTRIYDEQFQDYENVEEIVLPSTIKHIGKFAFCRCKSLKKINLPSNLKLLEEYAFAGCESLEEITIPPSLKYLAAGVFKDCKKLKKLKIHNDINYIDNEALQNCESLENFDIPTGVTSLGQMALMGCKKLKIIHIPTNLDTIESGALAFMDSLEKIIVDEENENYFTIDDDTVLVSGNGVIIQYAINCNRQEFSLKNYEKNKSEKGIYLPIYNIADFAFAGAKKLKKLTLSTEIESYGENTFNGCENLKELEFYFTRYGKSLLFSIFGFSKEKSPAPFEKIIIPEGVTALCDNISPLFKNAKEVILPSTLEQIGTNVFLESQNLTRLDIPKNIRIIKANTFADNIQLNFYDHGSIRANDFDFIEITTNEENYLQTHSKDNVKVFALKNGTYYIKIDDYDTIKISKKEIATITNNPNITTREIIKFIEYLNFLLQINNENPNLLNGKWLDKNLENLFKKFRENQETMQNISNHQTAFAIREIVDNAGTYNEFLFSNIIVNKLSQTSIAKILANYNNSINRFFRFGVKIDESTNGKIILNIDNLITYCNLLEEYHQYDKFLYNPVFFQNIEYENILLLVKHWNKNLKHLLQNSETMNDCYGNNLNDLIKLCKALGVFSDNKTISQRSTYFINEKILSPNSSNNRPNEYRVAGDNIHTIFGEINPREEVDFEFIEFFIKNYEELIKLEMKASGTIAKIYNNFREISKTSTSHRGEQRHLKVTIEKCQNYFLTNRFEGLTEENKKLAEILQAYYTERYALKIAEMILNQSQKAPRNIFSKINYDEEGKPIYSYDKSEDLYETNKDGFSYCWLPKQDYDNLILGKYCNCCAHILGAGAGIMRASMILDCCQNLVIKNNKGQIIAKMTIYVNREKGYAVFNTAEVNNWYLRGNDLNEIYKAFMRGVNIFVDKYNQNNKIPISIVSIGGYRNAIRHNIGNEETEVFDTPNYSEYGYYENNQAIGMYNGDAKNKQLLVLKRK